MCDCLDMLSDDHVDADLLQGSDEGRGQDDVLDQGGEEARGGEGMKERIGAQERECAREAPNNLGSASCD